ncbi:MAG: MopE-related protein [Minicystis sp.]
MRAIGALGALVIVALGAAGPGGCAQETAAPAGAPPERAVEARQALTTPTVCLQVVRPAAATAGAVADTQIANKLPPKNYGASGTFNTGTVGTEERQALLQFDLSGIRALPNTDAVVSSAVVTLSRGQVAPTGPALINVHRVTAPWSESAVTWQSLGGAFAPAVDASFDNAAATMTFSIPALIAGWANGTFPNHGILLEQPGPDVTSFWSSEYTAPALRPTLDFCYTLACKAGFADCNGVQADGCEIDIAGDVHNCGGCGVVCSVPNATPACNGGACAVGACNAGFDDCDKLAANGCETILTTATDCGACGVPCAPAHASSSCATGSCALTACAPGYYDCDGNPQNGCELMPCVDGSHCQVNAGCQSGVCASGFCAAPACADLVQNGAETDVDCGGANACPRCQPGQQCTAGSDCTSGVCQGSLCQPAACNDVVQNGAETDVDCGGANACPRCQPGQQCTVGSDCTSGVCQGGLCQAAACNDGLQNGAETAVDCGGANACPRCNPGKACLVGTDCVDLVCAGNVCQMASCGDGVQNGSETDVDCGATCPPCVPQERCRTNADCDSGVCESGVCQPPTCTDGVKNGNETGVDCGGACFRPETCNGVDDDCNGLVDDGLGSTTCGLGACQVTVPNCAGGQAQTCVPGSPVTEVCDGLIDDDCDGVVDNGCACVNGATQPCYTGPTATLGVGVCAAGTQTCVFGQWGACAGEVTPSAETCDGIDNDCNGQVDDGLGQTICGVGGCQVTVPNCVAGQLQACVPAAPQAEICDGIDNDCNGQVDDGLPAIVCGVGACQRAVAACTGGQPSTCVPGQPQAETCDGIDNDCDGVIDDGNPGGGLPCSTGKPGACSAGTTACAGGQIVCNQTAQPSAETCNGLDDDCDGVVDNGNPGGGAACSTGKPGICAAGVSVCSGGALSCQQSQAAQAESCNGLDDDCDGVIDNGNPGGGLSCSTGKQGVCGAGTTVCAGGQIACNQSVQPGTETCDGLLDENCNGQVDEGCNCVNGQTKACYAGPAGTAGVGICKAGTQTCANGNWGACTGQVTPGTETCNGLDDDCDGQVDEGLGTVSCGVGQCARTVSVCVNGHANACTPGAPIAETCNGLDDDCDGVIDNGNPGAGAACSTGKSGACAAGTTACVAGALSCNQTTAPSTEVCDGIDNDCDGLTDEGNPGGGQSCSSGKPGICAAGTTACSGGSLKCNQNQQPQTEICNTLDDDCDGQIDEGGICGTCGGTQSAGASSGGVLGGGTNGGGTASGGISAGGTVGASTVSFSYKTTSGNAECAAVGRTCTSASNNGSTVSCSSVTSYTSGSATCNATATGAGVTFANRKTSGTEECAAVGRSCTQAYNNGSSAACSSAVTYGSGVALCGAALSGVGISWSAKTTSGNAECAAIGRTCTSAYRDGATDTCANAATSTYGGSAVCTAGATGAGITFANKITSGDQECGAVGMSCTSAWHNGASQLCSTAASSTVAGVALCAATPTGWGVSWTNRATSGAQECAAVGRACQSAWSSGNGTSCTTAIVQSATGAALCTTASGAGVSWASKTTSGDAECSAVARTCVQAYRNGAADGCATVASATNGAAVCSSTTTGVTLTFSNKTTSGDAECGAVGLNCSQAWHNGYTQGCSVVTSPATQATVICSSTPAGWGTTVTNKKSSGPQACAAIGRSCTKLWSNGINWACGSFFSQSDDGDVLCGFSCLGHPVSWSNKTTSGDAECGAVGRACTVSYRDGWSDGCATAATATDGSAICASTTSGQGITWKNKKTSGDAECAALGYNCQKSWHDGGYQTCNWQTALSTSAVALCGTSLSGTPTSWSNRKTSGDQECAGLARSCQRLWIDGIEWACGSYVGQTAGGVAMCGTSTSGVGTSWSSKTTSGDAECAALGRTCSQTYRDGSSDGCSTAVLMTNGAAVCSSSTSGTGTTWSSMTTTGNAQCATLGKTCLAAWNNGASTSCSTSLFYYNGVARCN